MNPLPALAALFRATLQDLRTRPLRTVVCVVAGLLAAAALSPVDQTITRAVQFDGTKRFAQAVSFWGDYWTGTLILCAALWLVAAWCRQPRWTQAALAALVAATLAGAVAITLRPVLGRARPVANAGNGFHGPTMDASFHSFPSGHSATSVATAVPLLILLPPVGVPATLGAGLVVWSRVRLRQHRPGDVAAGAAVGLLFGLAAAAAARRIGGTDPAP
jgi:membrane-associated phospholipid phosphatase